MKSSNKSLSDHNNPVVALESTIESKTDYITYDGVARYVAPLTYNEHVTQCAQSIDWYELALKDNNPKYNVKDLTGDFERFEIQVQDEPDTNDDEANALAVARIDENGYAAIISKLRDALIQMQVLSDTIETAHDGKYLRFTYNEDYADDEYHRRNIHIHQPLNEAIHHDRKAFFQTVSKKVAQEASTHIQDSLRKMQMNLPNLQSNQSKKPCDNYLYELMHLKRNYPRLRKIQTTQGDLAYSHAQRMFDPSRTFKIERTPIQNNTPSNSAREYLTVTLPVNLHKSKTLVVDICHDSDTMDKMRAIVTPQSMSRYSWERKLEFAQHTLISTDIFELLHAQTIQQVTSYENMENGLDTDPLPYSDVIHENCIYLQLDDDAFRLRVALVDFPPAPPDSKEIASRIVASYLTRFVQHQYLKWHDKPVFALPICAAAKPPERNEESAQNFEGRFLQEAGALAMANAAIPNRQPVPLIDSVRLVAQHTLMTQRWMHLLHQYALKSDTHLSWRWLHVDNTSSSMKIQMSSVGFENITRLKALVELSPTTGLRILSSRERERELDSNTETYATDTNSMMSAIATLRTNLLISCIEKLTRHFGDRWQLTDYDARLMIGASWNPEISVLNCALVNRNFSRMIQIDIPLFGEPRIAILLSSCDLKHDASIEKCASSHFNTKRIVNFRRIPGRLVMDRINNLLSYLA